MAIPAVDFPLNSFKRALVAGKPQIGLWSSLCNPIATEILGGSGFDWLLIDGEHAPNDPVMVLSQLQALHGSATSPVVRMAWNDAVILKRHLDIGVQSFLIPFVQNAEEATRAVAATRFPQFGGGVRGFAAATRANRYGRVPNYHRRAHEELCVLVQVETRQALDNIEAIAAVEGIDGIFIGPADLSSDMGQLGNLSHPEVLAAISDAIRRIIAAGKPAGILTGVEAEAKRWLAEGATFVAVGSDVGVLARQTEALAARFKSPS